MGPSTRTCLFIISMQLIQAIYAQDEAKRTPQGFMAMRGKKLIETDQVYKRKLPYFIGVKGKNAYDYDPYSYYKRAPLGFFGMRGKKDLDSTEFYPDTYEYVPKRDGSVIGQIDYSVNDEILKQAGEFDLLDRLLGEYAKQKTLLENEPKADTQESAVSDEHSNELTKRAAQMHQFFGVRGKKSNKRPFDLSFRGKFVGVRGKKDVKGAKEVKFFVEGDPWQKRKGQMNGFFGMRGKKWVDETSTDSDATN